jgi:hypothetical protein
LLLIVELILLVEEDDNSEDNNPSSMAWAHRCRRTLTGRTSMGWRAKENSRRSNRHRQLAEPPGVVGGQRDPIDATNSPNRQGRGGGGKEI